MKIGIIVHSHTGNTFSVAQKLREKLAKAGHSVSLERVSCTNEDQIEAGKVHLTSKPPVSEYDMLIFGAPVRGFSLSPAMTAYLAQLDSFSDKEAACFLTEFFPFPSMGGNQAMKQMRALCSSKGIRIRETGIVNWSNLNRRKKIDELVERLGSMEM